MKKKTILLLTLTLLVCGNLQIIDGGQCPADKTCLILIRDPFSLGGYTIEAPPPLPPIPLPLIFLAGGKCSSGRCLIILDEPFYEYSGLDETVNCTITVNLTSPIEGHTYYDNNLYINYTFSRQPDTCFYRIQGYSWNSIPCNGSIRRTMPGGEQTLEVWVNKGLCYGNDTVTYTVYSRADYWGYIDYDFMTWILLGCVLLLYWVKPKKNK